MIPASVLRSIIVVSLADFLSASRRSAVIVGTCTAYLLASITLSSCNTATDTKAKTTPTPQKIRLINLPALTPLPKAEGERLKMACQQWYDTVLALKDFHGGMIVAKNGNVVFEKYNGTVHYGGNDLITDTTALHIASVSKTFTAMAVLKLWQDGKLHVDEEFSKYFPQFNYAGVTIRSLLNHRSGLPNYTHYLSHIGWDVTKVVTNQDVLNTLITNKTTLVDIAPPNTKFSYCNTNYALLALLIEKVSGSSYGTFLNNTFFAPLQMKHSYVFNMADSLKAPPSYDWKGRLMPFNFLDAVYGDKNIYTTPKDLLLWDRLLNTNEVFINQILNEAYKPYSNEKPGIKNYGLGWRMNIYDNNKKIIFHNGWWHGSNAVFMRLPDEKATIIVIGNKFTRAIYHARVLANLFGDYYAAEEEEEGGDDNKVTDSITTLNKKATFPKPKLSKKDSLFIEKFRDKNKTH
jgi:CubicO group peptidase (beta-lactamase class C family)